MKGEWERKGYTFQFSRTDTMMIPKLQYRSPFTNKDDNSQWYQMSQFRYISSMELSVLTYMSVLKHVLGYPIRD